ncbi:hypothetical protein [Escherichia coli]|uniref:hypothetical protein n=1 Tax=Escherichia coli TaxID=562 RepID=UPI000A19BCFC|nr:hypothetical protein [Escherichia coli]
METVFPWYIMFVIALFSVLLLFLLIKLSNKLERKLLGKYDKKTQLIIKSVIFLCFIWGLKWAGS